MKKHIATLSSVFVLMLACALSAATSAAQSEKAQEKLTDNLCEKAMGWYSLNFSKHG